MSATLQILPDMPICQQDYPLDRYQDEFRPYAEEYLALPDRLPQTVLPWMDRYVRPALDHFGSSLKLLAHYYMGGDIVKVVERYGGKVADSYELALQTREHPEATVFVESAVHFMAETISILAGPHQAVWITNPRSGCTMEMLAKDFMVEPAFEELRSHYGDDLLVVAYMNTSGRVKALAGRTGGAVCTSSNAATIVRWALNRNKKIFFVPDRHLGEVVASWSGVDRQDLFFWGGGDVGAQMRIDRMKPEERALFDRSRMILWGSSCGVHTIFKPEHVRYWKERGYRVLVHPECPKPVVDAADGAGSTKYLWGEIATAEPGSKIAVGTEGHFVRNAREQAAVRGVEVVHLADAPLDGAGTMGCGCATMSRNDPPHLVALVDLLVQGKAPEINRVLVGDAVDELSGARERLDPDEQRQVAADARAALERMVAITEAAG
jgi:quinolinate synthase